VEDIMLFKLKLYSVIAFVLFGMFGGMIHAWKRQIEAEELAKFNQAQLEQTLKDNEEYQRKMEAIQQNQIEIIKKNEEEKAQLQAKLDAVGDYLNSDAAKKNDVKSSVILKQTILRLQGSTK
jgi:hypothetical protein